MPGSHWKTACRVPWWANLRYLGLNPTKKDVASVEKKRLYIKREKEATRRKIQKSDEWRDEILEVEGNPCCLEVRDGSLQSPSNVEHHTVSPWRTCGGVDNTLYGWGRAHAIYLKFKQQKLSVSQQRTMKLPFSYSFKVLREGGHPGRQPACLGCLKFHTEGWSGLDLVQPGVAIMAEGRLCVCGSSLFLKVRISFSFPTAGLSVDLRRHNPWKERNVLVTSLHFGGWVFSCTARRILEQAICWPVLERTVISQQLQASARFSTRLYRWIAGDN